MIQIRLRMSHAIGFLEFAGAPRELPKKFTSPVTVTAAGIACCHDSDAETAIEVGARGGLAAPGEPVWAGILANSDRTLVIRNVSGERLGQWAASAEISRVRVWMDDPAEPDRVRIEVG